jgi:methylphosphotriester-DNA--protein-cysteine methyltransferase
MVKHIDLGETPFARLRNLVQKIKNQKLTLGGNCKLKIYGTFGCRAGKRMKAENRVFFKNEAEALEYGYRPCAVCMREAYRQWKLQNL